MTTKRIMFLRFEDLLSLEFELVNLTVSGSETQVLKRTNPGDAFLVVHFPPQHILEEIAIKSKTPKPPVQTELSSSSRLVFKVKDSVSEIPFTVEGLLNWNDNAYFVAVPTSLPLGDPHTAIEIPTRLLLAPEGQTVSWRHDIQPVMSAGITALWHTRLTITDGTDQCSLRAIGCKPAGETFESTIWDDLRKKIVHSMEQGEPDAGGKRPRIEARQLYLSALGGWLNINRFTARLPDESGEGDPLFWRHQVALGRDLFVTQMIEGYLFPFGHRAQYIEISERSLAGEKVASGELVAYLRTRQYLIVSEPEKTYELGSKNGKLSRQMPFKRIRLLTTETPELYPPQCVDGTGCRVGQPVDGAFWPMSSDDGPLLFEVVATDLAEQQTYFTTPLIWMNKDLDNEPAKMKKLIEAYRAFTYPVDGGAVTQTARERAINNQTITFAPEDRESVPGFVVDSDRTSGSQRKASNTTFETEAVTFDVKQPDPDDPNISHTFFPVVEKAKVSLPALTKLSGKSVVEYIAYDDSFLSRGWDGNEKHVFARIVDETVAPAQTTLSEYRDKWMSLGAPPIDGINALSSTLGAVVDTDPKRFLNLALAQGIMIFGGILLDEIVDLDFDLGDGSTTPIIRIDTTRNSDCRSEDALLDDSLAALKELADNPELIVEASPDVEAYVNLVEEYLSQGWDAIKDKITFPGAELVILEWKPLTRKGPKPGSPLAPRSATNLEMEIRLCAPFDAKNRPPTYSVKGTLTDFTIDLLPGYPLVSVEFKRLSFEARNGSKPKITPELGEIEFKDNLRFVARLAEELRKIVGGFGDGPFVTVDTSAVRAGFEYEFPAITLGAMNLSNITLSTALTVPFVEQPLSLAFNFCQRHSPFRITVGPYGGGGYFMLEVALRGLNWLEAGFEFGAYLTLDLGVASGGVSAAVGFFYRKEKNNSHLSAFLRLEGYLDVLGMVTVNAVFCLSLTYRQEPNDLHGQASITVTVRAFMYKEKVTMTVERRLSPSAGVSGFISGNVGTGFADFVPEDAWKLYAAAFAPEM